MIRNGTLAAYLLCGTLFCLAVYFVSTDSLKEESLNEKVETPLEQKEALLDIQGFRYAERSQGSIDAEISAERALYFSKGRFGRLDKPKISVFDQEKKILTVDAEHLEIHVRNQEVIVKGEIRVRTETGYELMTSSLKYYPRANKFTTPGKVWIKGPDKNIEKTGMVVDIRKQVIKFGDNKGGLVLFQDDKLLGAARKLTVICQNLIQDLLRDVTTLKIRRREVPS